MGGWEDAGSSELAHTAAFVSELSPQHLSVKRIEAYPGAPWSEQHAGVNDEGIRGNEGSIDAPGCVPAGDATHVVAQGIELVETSDVRRQVAGCERRPVRFRK